MKQIAIVVLVLRMVMFPDPLCAKEYAVPAKVNLTKFFAELPEDATQVNFSEAAEYSCTGDIVLPDRRLLVIDGKGATLMLGPESNGFTRMVTDQQQAMDRVSSRYVIRDFADIKNGRKAIDLQATLGSVVENCRMTNQSEVAVDLRFCLMARLQNILVTNPRGQGIVLRQGDWPGATAFNSQCNSTVLEQCRVNCSKTTTEAFLVRNSGGVRMTDCVSEGAPCTYDLYLTATIDGDEGRPASNTVVKSFELSNFHVEHSATRASIYVNMPSKSSVSLSNVYWNAVQKAPVILYGGGQLNISDIGWWRKEFRIHSRGSAPRITIARCHSDLNLGNESDRTDLRAGSLYLADAYPNNTQLKLMYVKVVNPSR